MDKPMDIANLQAFIAIAESASFSLAATQLHLTQPAISKRISALESHLQIRLFDRIGRRILLTEAGRTLLPRAQRILADIEDSQRALRNLSGQVAGALTIATSHHVGLHRLPPILRDFAARYPDVQLDMHFTDSELAYEAIAHGEAEIGIVTLPLSKRPAIKTQPIWNDPLVTMVNREHPLAGQATVTPRDLSRYPAILPGEVTVTRQVIDRLFNRLGVSLKLAFATNYLETIKMMVSVGLGWSILPRTMLDTDLLAVDLEGFQLERQLGVVLHTDHTLSNAATAMLDILEQERRLQVSKERGRIIATRRAAPGSK